MKRLTSFVVALFLATNAIWAVFTPAAFTVSADGKKVSFSQGNLQCSGVTTSTYTWSFAENQYDMLGTANVSDGTESYDATYGYSKDGTALADKIDLFGWSGSTGTAPWGISTSQNSDDYAGDFVDWGTNTIGTSAPNTYRTLTSDEWIYIFEKRTNACEKKGVARIQISDTEYANGFILLPDSWTCPEDVTFKSGFASEWSIEAYATYQTFTLAQWQQLENAGAVFLPASGNRRGSSVDGVLHDGYFWSATAAAADFSNYACFLAFDSNGAYGGFSPLDGQAVRLVQDLYAVTLTTPEHGTIAADKIEAVAGETITLTITPDTGYELDVLTIQDAAGNPVTVNDNKFTMPASNVTVSATFQQISSAVGNTTDTADTTVRKILRNGQVLILRNDKTYTLTGVEVK